MDLLELLLVFFYHLFIIIYFIYLYLVDIRNPYKLVVLNSINLKGWCLHLRIILND